MKKISVIYISILTSALFLHTEVNAQNLKTVIKTQAMEMAGSLLKKDYPNFIKYMHPKVIEMAGGEKLILSKMDTMNKMAKEFGASISRVLLGHPDDIINYKKQLQCTLSQTTFLKTMLGTISIESTLIAISENNGKNWYFIDTSVYNMNDLKKSLPDISPEIKISPMKEPKIIPNE